MKKLILTAMLAVTLLSCGSNSEKNDSDATKTDKVENAQTAQIPLPGSGKGLPVVVDFSASWCGPCRMMKPIFENLEKEYTKDVEFVTVDIDSFPDLADRFQVQAVPTIVFLDKEGKEVDRSVGLVDKSVLVDKIERLK